MLKASSKQGKFPLTIWKLISTLDTTVVQMSNENLWSSTRRGKKIPKIFVAAVVINLRHFSTPKRTRGRGKKYILYKNLAPEKITYLKVETKFYDF